MGLLLFLLTCILITFSYERARLFLAGLLAGAVVCNPYLVFLWLTFSLVVLIDRLSFHRIPKGYWLFTTIGIGAAFFLFCTLMLINAPLREYLKVLPLILDDPEHPLTPFWEKAIYIIYHARQVNSYWLGLIVFSLAVILQTKLCKTISLGFSLTCGVVIALLFSYRVGYHLINFTMFPLSLLGLFCAACSKDTEIKTVFFDLASRIVFFLLLRNVFCNCISCFFKCFNCYDSSLCSDGCAFYSSSEGRWKNRKKAIIDYDAGLCGYGRCTDFLGIH